MFSPLKPWEKSRIVRQWFEKINVELVQGKTDWKMWDFTQLWKEIHPVILRIPVTEVFT